MSGAIASRASSTRTRAASAAACIAQQRRRPALLDEVADLVEFPSVVAGHLRRRVPRAARGSADDDDDPSPAFLPGRRTITGADAGVPRRDEHRSRATPARIAVNAGARADGAAARRAVLLGRRPQGDARGAPRSARHAAVPQGARELSAEGRRGSKRWPAGSPSRRFGTPPKRGDAPRGPARLAKADLATDMVREFTELQGTMGGIYAREEGEPEAGVEGDLPPLPAGRRRADAPPTRERARRAARDVGGACRSPTSSTRVVGLFVAGERPTGSRDPFGLRRQAHGLLRVLVDLPELDRPATSASSLGAAGRSQALRRPRAGRTPATTRRRRVARRARRRSWSSGCASCSSAAASRRRDRRGGAGRRAGSQTWRRSTCAPPRGAARASRGSARFRRPRRRVQARRNIAKELPSRVHGGRAAGGDRRR